MPVATLTTQFLSTLPAFIPSTGAVSYFDTEIKGFMLEYRAAGSGTYYYRYRDGMGKVRMSRICRMNDLPLADVRAKAHAIKLLVSEGGDPIMERHRFKDTPTFADFVQDRYLPYAKVKKRSWATDECVLRLHLIPIFGAVRLDRITRSEVIAMHHEARNKGYAAGTCNRMLVLMKFLFNCAIRWDILPGQANPCVGVEAFVDNGARERYLTEEEAKALFEELARNGNVQVARVVAR